MVNQFDAIIVGTGQAGPSLAARLTTAGMKVAIVERGKFGGTCVNTGCIPTKTLVASARVAHLARRSAEFGVMLQGAVSVDMKRVKARKDEVAGQSNRGVEKWLKGMKNCTVFEGHARFEAPKKIRVGAELLQAERIFINVGGRALVPPIPGLESVPFLTNSSMMEVDFLPSHLIVMGGSYVGLEFAQMYRRFGSRVTVIERSAHLISRDDEDISEAVRDILEKEEVQIRTGTEVVGVQKATDGVVVRLRGGEEIRGSHLLLAIGRVPNTDDLGLEKAGIVVDKRGYIVVDEKLETNVAGVFALGDCNGKGAFTHTSYNDFEIVAANVLDGGSRRWTDRILTYGLFIDPPLGRAGMTEKEARASGKKVLKGTLKMERVGRARERSETQGLMKILIDADSRLILGGAFLGIEGDEVIQVILDLMYANAPYDLLRRAVHIHPTVAEFLPTLVSSLTPLEG